MDASMSGMGGMGMDSGSGGMFIGHNRMLADTYWYLIAGFFSFAFLLRGFSALESWSRKRTRRALSVSHPTRPRNFVSQGYATAVAIFREISYPQIIHFSHPWWTWLSPPPLGRTLVILIYWAIITLFLTTGSIIKDAYYWERIAFRAAWVSVTQVPFIYLLAGKINVAGFLLGSSYVDMNWLHRWVSRTLFVTVTIHGTFFIREWVRADFFKVELMMMPMVKYGLGLWSVLAWTTITSFVPLRRLSYEFFVFQHIASAAIFLWLLYVHVPSYATYNVWVAIAFVLFGRVARGILFVYRNIGFRIKGSALPGSKAIGHLAEMKAMPGGITSLTVRGIPFSWKAGQYVLLWCPTIGPLESHPFTISNAPQRNGENGTNIIELVILARSGFTRRLYRRAASAQASASILRTFVTGPFGILPTWNTYETLVLISASTGASFTLPILESVSKDPCCVRRIDCLLLVRDVSQLDGYVSRLLAISSDFRCSEVSIQIEIAITGKDADRKWVRKTENELESLSSSGSSQAPSTTLLKSQATMKEHSLSTLQNDAEVSEVATLEEKSDPKADMAPIPQTKGVDPADSIRYSFGRPRLSDVIRGPVEASAGECSVVVCGGKNLTSDVRNIVARLSDERAVHKGTGAQGIHLHVEAFGS